MKKTIVCAWLVTTAVGLLIGAKTVRAEVGRVIRSAHTPLTHEAFNTVKQHAAESFSRIRDAGRSSTSMQGSSIRSAFAEHRQRAEAHFPRARTQRLR